MNSINYAQAMVIQERQTILNEKKLTQDVNRLNQYLMNLF